jgi:hypothetical protein
MRVSSQDVPDVGFAPKTGDILGSSATGLEGMQSTQASLSGSNAGVEQVNIQVHDVHVDVEVEVDVQSDGEGDSVCDSCAPAPSALAAVRSAPADREDGRGTNEGEDEEVNSQGVQATGFGARAGDILGSSGTALEGMHENTQALSSGSKADVKQVNFQEHDVDVGVNVKVDVQSDGDDVYDSDDTPPSLAAVRSTPAEREKGRGKDEGIDNDEEASGAGVAQVNSQGIEPTGFGAKAGDILGSSGTAVEGMQTNTQALSSGSKADVKQVNFQQHDVDVGVNVKVDVQSDEEGDYGDDN